MWSDEKNRRGETPVLSEVSVSVEESPDEEPLLHFEKSSKTYNNPKFWRRNLFAVLIPFFACGLPLHILSSGVDKHEDAKNEDVYPLQWKTWYRYRFQSKTSTFMTILLFPVFLISNAYFIYLIQNLLYEWFILGELTLLQIFDIGNLLIIGPFVMTVNYIWSYSHAVAPILKSLLQPIAIPSVNKSSENLVSPSAGIDSAYDASDLKYYKDLEECTQYNSRVQMNITTIKTEIELQGFRFYTLRSYAFWMATHVFHLLIFQHRIKIEKWSTEAIYRQSVNYFCIIFYTFMFITHSNFSGIILWKMHRLNNYLRKLGESGDKLKMSHIHYIKRTFSRIADDIMHVNFLCRRLFLFIWLVMYYTVLTNALEMILFLIGRIIWGIQEHFKDTGESDWSRKFSLITLDVALSEDSVRIFIGLIVETLMYIYLTLNCLYDAVHANDEVRYLHVRVNNLAADLAAGDHRLTQFPIQVDDTKTWWMKQNFVNEDVYRAFFLLKQYLHSRMETHAGKHRALLNMFGLSYFQPNIAKRLYGYKQTN
ncbi:unnamed protein product [Allacma fusca]|uniref:Uncharacterized protein n=1 Tax=Allacma fusca TaxID=39272 RepID=A0A8J2L0B3_9HEXA|nr:unnamed protein product [Allacma fusca]